MCAAKQYEGYDSMTLLGRNAIVTGGSTGLGQAIARAFLAEGANVAICSRDANALEETVQCLRAFAGDERRVFARPCDVSREDQVQEFIGAAIEQFGRIEILINNAGVLGPIGKTETVANSEWR